MPKKTDLPQATSPSLVPLLEAEEKHLDELLEAAKKDANTIVEEARREAARRVKAAEAGPAPVQDVSTAPEAVPPDHQASLESRRVEGELRPNIDKAAEFILSKVWPGGES